MDWAPCPCEAAVVLRSLLQFSAAHVMMALGRTRLLRSSLLPGLRFCAPQHNLILMSGDETGQALFVQCNMNRILAIIGTESAGAKATVAQSHQGHAFTTIFWAAMS